MIPEAWKFLTKLPMGAIVRELLKEISNNARCGGMAAIKTAFEKHGCGHFLSLFVQAFKNKGYFDLNDPDLLAQAEKLIQETLVNAVQLQQNLIVGSQATMGLAVAYDIFLAYNVI